MKWITYVIANWATLMIVSGLFSPKFSIDGITVALLAAVILAIMNTIVKPILVFFTLPITIFSLGLFLLVINALTLYATAYLVEGFHIDGFVTALWTGIIVGVCNTVIQKLLPFRS